MSSGLLREKVFIVTGGTQGLGKGIALHLADCGAEGIVICGRHRENGKRSAREIMDTWRLFWLGRSGANLSVRLLALANFSHILAGFEFTSG